MSTPALVMVTGHRPPGIGGYHTPNPTERWVRASLESILRGFQRKYTSVGAISGMAIGTDLLYAEVALSLGIPVHAAVPFKGHDSQWPASSRNRFLRVLSQCASVNYVCEPPYAAWKLKERNLYMVSQATHAIAVWDGMNVGGTAHTVRALRSNSTPTMWVNPASQVIGPLTAH